MLNKSCLTGAWMVDITNSEKKFVTYLDTAHQDRYQTSCHLALYTRILITMTVFVPLLIVFSFYFEIIRDVFSTIIPICTLLF